MGPVVAQIFHHYGEPAGNPGGDGQDADHHHRHDDRVGQVGDGSCGDFSDLGFHISIVMDLSLGIYWV